MKVLGAAAAPLALPFRRASWLSLASLLALFICEAACHEVYLREMTIHKDHEEGLHGSKPEVYMSCEADDRGKIDLGRVKHTETKYEWEEEKVPVTYIGDDECRKCTLKEADWPDSDDTFGSIDICAKHFHGEEGMNTYSIPGEFDAKFQCKECVRAKAPTTLPEALKNVNTTELVEEEEEGEEEELEREEDAERVLADDEAIREWLREQESSTNSTNVTHTAVHSNQTVSGGSYSSMNQTEEVTEDGSKVVRVESSESHSSGSGIRTTTKSVVMTTTEKSSKPGKKHSSAVVPIVIVLSMCCLLAGVVAGALLYRSHQARMKRKEEEKMKELDAILGDPNVDFEEMMVQEKKAMNWNMSSLLNWKPRMWSKVPDEQEQPQGRPRPGTQI